MKISYIITISSVIPFDYLNALITSLNIQTSNNFEVVFYNQTKKTIDDIFNYLRVKPIFEYSFFPIEEQIFLGEYPIWNLYGFHQDLLDNDLLCDYFMSLHMEEFLTPDYTEQVLEVLKENNFDILFGNLHRTGYSFYDVKELSDIDDAQRFNDYLESKNIKKSIKWGLPNKPFFLTRSPQNLINNFRKLKLLKWKKRFDPTQIGFFKFEDYILEDIFIMSKSFAKKYRWYDSKVKLYFEDIHINFSLKNILKQITTFPVYFNKSKIYHLKHGKFYYQIEDDEFSNKLLEYNTDSPILLSLKNGIILSKSKRISTKKALRLSRTNPRKIGTADLNYQFHVENIKDVSKK